MSTWKGPPLRDLTPPQRFLRLAPQAGLDDDDRLALESGGLDLESADRMIENVVGLFALPMGVAVHLTINGRERPIPLVLEEASVVAGLSHAGKLLAAGGGIESKATESLMIGQIQLVDVPDLEGARRAIEDARAALIHTCDGADRILAGLGGGVRELEVRRLDPSGADDPLGPMLVVHIIADVRDAMGANAVNTMAECIAPELARLSGGRARLRILSNLADRRTVTARGRVPFAALARVGSAGADVGRGIVEASVFAERDPYRAATHNKGIMNGVDGVLLATGQDWRAVEAGAHAFAARGERYGPLSRWRIAGDVLSGELTMPMAVGVVGGAVAKHRGARAALKLLGVETARDLAEIAGAVGLAQNLAALRALAAEGIQAGHMKLHQRKG